MVARGYTGGGSAKDARPPRRLPSGARRIPPDSPDSAHLYVGDPHGLRQVVGTGGAAPLAQNRSGRWVPAIPLPLYGRLRKRCSCGQAFWTMTGFRGHYALAHVLEQD